MIPYLNFQNEGMIVTLKMWLRLRSVTEKRTATLQLSGVETTKTMK
jgi:hypothetical protein